MHGTWTCAVCVSSAFVCDGGNCGAHSNRNRVRSILIQGVAWGSVKSNNCDCLSMGGAAAGDCCCCREGLACAKTHHIRHIHIVQEHKHQQHTADCGCEALPDGWHTASSTVAARLY